MPCPRRWRTTASFVAIGFCPVALRLRSRTHLFALEIWCELDLPMIVGDVMTIDVVTVRPLMSWREAAELLLTHRCSAAPVIDDSGKLVGVLSEKDLFRGLFPSYKDWATSPEIFVDFEAMEMAGDAAGKTVRDVMAQRVVVASPHTPVLKVGAIMVSSGMHHLPVVEGERLVGMVGRGDIYRAILRNYFGVGN